jgi:hypothetical protein
MTAQGRPPDVGGTAALTIIPGGVQLLRGEPPHVS